MADERDEIRKRVDLVELVGQTVRLKKAGRDWKGLCPFHPDKNPSFSVSSEFGRYTCWSCGAKGDVFDWVMNTQHVDFRDALEILARHAGITLKERSPEEISLVAKRREAMEEAQRFFRQSLSTSTIAKDYCAKRGLDEATLTAWEIGYAPDVGEALAIHLKKKGHNLNECRELFLVEKDPSGSFYDRFRGRLMFPIRDERGDLVAFGGRMIGDGHPKYVNSSDTPLYKKSKVLYGLQKAKEHISKESMATLCEGYLDVIACHRAGIQTAVASLGTALSEDHAHLLRRWAEGVTILYDGDDAGQKATERALDVLGKEAIVARIAVLGQGHDPDTLLKEKGPSAVQALVKAAMKPLDYRINRLEARTPPSTEKFWSEVVPLLAEAESEMDLATQIIRLSSMYPGLRDPVAAQRALKSQVNQARKVKGKPTTAAAQPKAAIGFRDMKPAEATLFRGFLDMRFRRRAAEALRESNLLVTAYAQAIAASLLGAFPDRLPEGPPSAWIHEVPADDAEVLMRLSDDAPISDAVIQDAVEALRKAAMRRNVGELRSSEGDQRLAEISRLLKSKEKN